LPDHVIDRVYAGDRISDLLAHASRQTLLVTNLSSALLVCAAELMDVPAVCLVGGRETRRTVSRATRGARYFAWAGTTSTRPTSTYCPPAVCLQWTAKRFLPGLRAALPSGVIGRSSYSPWKPFNLHARTPLT